MNKYETEAGQRWGNTETYREYSDKTKGYTEEKWVAVNDGLMAVFAEFSALKNSGASADSSDALALVAKLQAYISDNYYTCTSKILAGLGNMYVADERFRENINKCGDGTAEFVSEAIAVFRKGKKND